MIDIIERVEKNVFVVIGIFNMRENLLSLCCGQGDSNIFGVTTVLVKNSRRTLRNE